MFYEVSPALALLSFRAKVNRNAKPHLPNPESCILSWIESGGSIADLKPADFAEARRLQRENNRRNAKAKAAARV